MDMAVSLWVDTSAMVRVQGMLCDTRDILVTIGKYVNQVIRHSLDKGFTYLLTYLLTYYLLTYLT